MSEHPGSRFRALRRKARAGIWVEALGTAIVALCGYAALTLVIDRSLRLEWPFRLLLLCAFAFLLVRELRARLVDPLAVPLDDDEMALAVERAEPAMRQALISSVQFERVLAADVPVPESRELMEHVVDDVRTRLQTLRLERALDGRRVLRFLGLGLAGLLLFGGWAGVDPASLRLWALRNLGLSLEEWPRYTQLRFLLEGEAGDAVRLPQGDSLTVRVAASGVVPDQVFLYYRFKGGESGYEPMSGTGEAEFTLTLESVLENVELHAEGGDGISGKLRVSVVERPRIQDLVVTVSFPEYMQKEPDRIEGEAELRIPRGARLHLEGRSHKVLRAAFLLFAEQRTPMNLVGENAFEGAFAPVETGLLVVDVIDLDSLGAGVPPRLYLRMTDDRPPTLDFRLRGIGSLITAQARLQGELKVKDDFGIRGVDAAVRAVPEGGGGGSRPAEPEEVPFAAVGAIWGTSLQPGALRYETAASVDLLPLARDPNPDSPDNPIRPGMLLSLRFAARDNYGPGDPHEAFSEVLTLRVVTPEKLIEELRRRQVEQRQELQRILEEEKLGLLELRETMNPTKQDERAALAQARLKTVSRQQQALGRRVDFVADSYQRILWEYENNRVMDPPRVREVEALITQPLAALAKDDFPSSSRTVEHFANSGDEALRSDALQAYEKIIRRIEAVLKDMTQAETLAALLEELRAVIKMQDSTMHDVERRLREAVERLFNPGKK